MLTTVRGHYENGQIILDEIPPVQTKSEVIVTFMTERNDVPKKGKRVLGLLEGKITIPDDFNDPISDFNDID